jgi:cell division protein ZapA (FtsZ GTPase activity inhibitor)
MDEISITVVITDRPYRLTIKKVEEEAVRKAARLINERAKIYAENYAFKDKQDLLAMAALEFATQTFAMESKKSATDSEVYQRLERLNYLLGQNI